MNNTELNSYMMILLMSFQISILTKTTTLLFCLMLTACTSAHKSSNTTFKQPIESSKSLTFSAIKTAKAQLGTKYRYGGNKPNQGFDCSGLIHYSFSKAGLVLPRSSRAQFAALPPTTKPKQGDLVYFGSKGRVNHAGIYLGNNEMLHSPSTGGRVEIVRIDTPRWQKRYLGARIAEQKS